MTFTYVNDNLNAITCAKVKKGLTMVMLMANYGANTYCDYIYIYRVVPVGKNLCNKTCGKSRKTSEERNLTNIDFMSVLQLSASFNNRQ